MANTQSSYGRFGEIPRVNFGFGIGTSLALHFFLALYAILVLEKNSDKSLTPNQVFSVTLEGGQSLGGISQAPKPGAKKILTPEQNQEEPKKAPEPEEKPPPKEEVKEKAPPPEPKQEPVPEKKLTDPSVVEDPEKAKRLLEEKKREDEQRKKQQEEKEKKRKEEEKKIEEKKREEKEKQNKEKEREDRNRKLDEALKRVQNQYEGESAAAGGKGFGAGALGPNKGMGGGTLTSLEKFAYQNELQRYVKQGWHWLGGSEHLVAKVRVKILPSGELQNTRIELSSGNRSFDDSVVRAVAKASPVPPPPPSLYQDFQDVVFSFDSRE